MSKYSYPAIFTPEENGMYSVHFPDVQGCYTCGDNLINAIEMAQDALALMLSTYEIEGLKFSDPHQTGGIPPSPCPLPTFRQLLGIFLAEKRASIAVIGAWIKEN